MDQKKGVRLTVEELAVLIRRSNSSKVTSNKRNYKSDHLRYYGKSCYNVSKREPIEMMDESRVGSLDIEGKNIHWNPLARWYF